MYCSKCGAHLEDDDEYCSACGCKTVSTTSENAVLPHRRLAFWLKGIGILVSVIALVWFLSLYFVQDVYGSIEGQLDALRENKITEAYYAYTTQSFQEATSLEAFRKFVQSFPAFYHNQSVTLEHLSMQDTNGIVQGVLHSADGHALPIEYKLLKEDGKWKIQLIEVKYTSSDLHPDEGEKPSNPELQKTLV